MGYLFCSLKEKKTLEELMVRRDYLQHKKKK